MRFKFLLITRYGWITPISTAIKNVYRRKTKLLDIQFFLWFPGIDSQHAFEILRNKNLLPKNFQLPLFEYISHAFIIRRCKATYCFQRSDVWNNGENSFVWNLLISTYWETLCRTFFFKKTWSVNWCRLHYVIPVKWNVKHILWNSRVNPQQALSKFASVFYNACTILKWVSSAFFLMHLVYVASSASLSLNGQNHL